ncbi:MAG: hypothetical protein PS018_17380 [bacterium]|nr:hypothetical protein [bacterium]
MKWMRERDLLIAQTMAFVQSVTGKKPETDKAVAMPAAPFPDEAFRAVEQALETPAAMPDVALLRAGKVSVSEPAKPAIARLDLRADFQSEISEIKARVANFRAHQERFHREREAYCSATMDKVHKSLREFQPRPGK